MIFNRLKSGCNRLLCAGAVLAIFMAATFLQINSPTGSAHAAARPNGTIFDIFPTGVTPSSLPSSPGSSFFIQGNIYTFKTIDQGSCQFPAGAEVLGTWRAWGVVAEDGSRLLTNQSYTLDKSFNGQINVQGPSGVLVATGPLTSFGGVTTGPTEVVSVTGGAGLYKGANGEGRIRPYCSDPSRTFRYDRPFCFLLVSSTD